MGKRGSNSEVCCHLMLILGGAAIALASTAAAEDRVSINCGSFAPLRGPNGREWLGDLRSKYFTIEGVSTTMRCKHDADMVPYSTARVSRAQFSYGFRLNPGEKFIRLHFGKGFEDITDLFSVEAGSFTLLYNFSATITARALALDAVVKEFCLKVEENQPLDIIFTPTPSPLFKAYAFVNGIEIVSLPSGLSCQGGANGVPLVGQNIDRGVAVEIVRRVDMKLDSAPTLVGDVGNLARTWKRNLKQKDKSTIEKNMTWKTSVDVGFRYMVRVHFSEIGLKTAEAGGKDFSVVIDGVVAATAEDVLKSRKEEGFLWQKSYMVVLSGRKRDAKRDIVVSFHSEYGFADGNDLFEGFEIFKISNFDNSLAGLNPILPSVPNSSPLIGLHAFFLLIGRRNGFSNVIVILICLANVIAHLLRKILGVEFTDVAENKPSARAKRLCCLFSLDEIKSSTDDFHDRFLIGRGGFGNVYKGTIDNGRETVAIKRLKANSKQGKREFWTEIEALSELRHLNLVSLIGYCKAHREMIIVYEYIPRGSLADHLYKFSRKNAEASSLSWIQRLGICIGAARGLDYLHTGHEIIHRDIKSSNILLGEKLVAKVSDFGLAKWESGKMLQSLVSTHVKGSPGYLDPNYIITHRFTAKSDTYSFGVVLLEVLCGRPAVEPFAAEDRRSLIVWFRNKIWNGERDLIIDPSIKKEISPASLAVFLGIVEKCLHDEPSKRPTLAHVIVNLELALEKQEHGKSLMPNEITRVSEFIPHSKTGCLPFTTTPSGSTALMTQSKNQMLSGSNERGRKAVKGELEETKIPEFNPFNITGPLSLPRPGTAPLTPSKNQMLSGSNECGRKAVKGELEETKIPEFNPFDITGPFSRLLPGTAPLTPSKNQMLSDSKKHGRKAAMDSTVQSKNQMSSGNKKHGRKTAMGKLVRFLPFHVVWRTKEPSMEDCRVPVSAPVGGVFSFSELQAATESFSTALGSGGFGTVYKGWLKNSDGGIQSRYPIAVKRLSSDSMQGIEEWKSEIMHLTKISHPNLVKLLGYCCEDKELLLVYEFMELGSLDVHLFNKDRPVLEWDTRLAILTGVARGLAFLHSLNIIWRDGKTSNILLHDMYSPKIGDFGLAKSGPADKLSHVTTQIIGTKGYAAPEYMETGHLTAKCDVYGFGVMMLEMLTGLPVHDPSRPHGRTNLVYWLRPRLHAIKKLANIMDSSLNEAYTPKAAHHAAIVAGRCLSYDPERRPSMEEALKLLEQIRSNSDQELFEST